MKKKCCEMRFGNTVIFLEDAGVISKDEIWVAFSGPYMYEGDTLPKLLWNMLKRWQDDRQLVG